LRSYAERPHRCLAVLQVRENGFTVVEQAPRTFQGAGG
jgi:hypothetical protein